MFVKVSLYINERFGNLLIKVYDFIFCKKSFKFLKSTQIKFFSS